MFIPRKTLEGTRTHNLECDRHALRGRVSGRLSSVQGRKLTSSRIEFPFVGTRIIVLYSSYLEITWILRVVA